MQCQPRRGLITIVLVITLMVFILCVVALLEDYFGLLYHFAPQAAVGDEAKLINIATHYLWWIFAGLVVLLFIGYYLFRQIIPQQMYFFTDRRIVLFASDTGVNEAVISYRAINDVNRSTNPVYYIFSIEAIEIKMQDEHVVLMSGLPKGTADRVVGVVRERMLRM